MARPCFNAPVAPGGYRWWYIDALSDDGQNGLTIIGFVGSVFSPYYMRARRTGNADAENHCAINVALYGNPRRWSMTERGVKRVVREQERLAIGPSSMEWNGRTLTILVNERCAPLPLALRGRITFEPSEIYDQPVPLDEDGRHQWQAVAPHGRITAELESPRLNWSGSGYHDMNWGDEPLEDRFSEWTWLRTHTNRGTEVLYDLNRKDGSRLTFGRRFEQGKVTNKDCAPRHAMRKGFWGMQQHVLSEAPAALLDSLEDAPFYTRNRVAITIGGQRCEAFQESLSLDRFAHPMVQLMLPFRMPRLA